MEKGIGYGLEILYARRIPGMQAGRLQKAKFTLLL